MRKKTRTGLLITIVGGVVAAVAAFFLPKVYPRALGFLRWARDALLGLIHIQVPLWLLVLIPLCIWIVVCLYRAATGTDEKSVDLPENSYLRDSFDEFPGIEWEWTWLDGKPGRPKPFCRRCSTALQRKVDRAGLVDVSYYGKQPITERLVCTRCNTTLYSYVGDEGTIVSLARDVRDGYLRSGRWKQRVEEQQQIAKDKASD
ncbi:MAG: hypothetical protein AABO41_13295 [Acidobacteriota bacterium]